jgi:hypothetical protein
LTPPISSWPAWATSSTLMPRSAALRRFTSATSSGLPVTSDESTSTAPGMAFIFLPISSAYLPSWTRSGPIRVYWTVAVRKAPPPKAATCDTVVR